MNECKIDGQTTGSSPEDLIEAWQDDLYWIRFFARPCCPAPDLEGAVNMLDRLADEVNARGDFTPDEKRTLLDMIENRKAWYPTSGLCRAKRR